MRCFRWFPLSTFVQLFLIGCATTPCPRSISAGGLPASATHTEAPVPTVQAEDARPYRHALAEVSTEALKAESKSLRERELSVGDVDAQMPIWLALLTDEDPVRRDEIAYTDLAYFVLEKGLVSESRMCEAVAELLPRLAVPEAVDDADAAARTAALIRRSFAALGLSVLAARDAKAPYLSLSERERLVNAARNYARAERDYRPREGRYGWLHAAAHTADLLKFLSRSEASSDASRAAILEATADIIVRPHGHIFHHGEDGRLAMTIFEVYKRAMPEAVTERFLNRLTAPFATEAAMPFDGTAYAAQRNARAVLLSLFTLLSSPSQKPPSAELLRVAVAKRLYE